MGGVIRIFAVAAFLSAAGAAATPARAAGATAEDAVGIAARFSGRERALGHRAKHRGRRGMRPGGRPTGRTRTFSENGESLFHLVEMDGGGFVAVSAAGTGGGAVMGFSASGEMPDESPYNPFWTLSARTARAMPVAAASTSRITSEAELDDVRVSPLVQSKWDQKRAGGENTYNYYTPNNWYCGCVATAMAQLMRYHCHPKQPVTRQTVTCFTNDVPVELTMKGGPYNWELMPYRPDSSTSDAEREAIGRICYDAGVAMHMSYGSNGSGAYGEFVAEALKNAFDFANAQYASFEDVADFATLVQDTILTNLDAGYPVLLGIFTSNNAGHAILADGYGYCDGTLYCHLNMGWSGSDDYWYALPVISTGAYKFTALDGVAYNIFPNFTGEIASGRVTDPSGEPVAGATVSATMTYKSGWSRRTASATATADENGIFAIIAPGGVTSKVVMSVSRDGWTAPSFATNVAASVSPRGLTFDDATGRLYASSFNTSTGSRWGNNIVFGGYSGAAPAVSSFGEGFGASTGWALSFSGTPGAWYVVEKSESLANARWEAFARVVAPSEGALQIEVEPAVSSGSMFYRIRPAGE